MKLSGSSTPQCSRPTDARAPFGLIGRLSGLLPKYVLFAMVAACAALMAVSVAQAQITPTGDVEPATDPSTWTTTSTVAYIGNTADGSLTIAGGSTVNSQYGYLGYTAGVTGTVDITGTGSTFTTKALYDAYSGTGNLSIESGGNLTTSSAAYVGYSALSNGTATVSGTGSKWTGTGALYVGNSGTGTLNISNGGTVTSASATIGSGSGSTGTATVDGSGTSWKASSILVGSSGTGTLNITNGSLVTATGTTTVGTHGTVNFGANGGTLNTGILSAASTQFTGTGTVVAHGWLGDANLTYNGTVTPLTVATYNGTNQDVTVNLDLSGSGGITANLAVGYQNSGSLNVQNGARDRSSHRLCGRPGRFDRNRCRLRHRIEMDQQQHPLCRQFRHRLPLHHQWGSREQ